MHPSYPVESIKGSIQIKLDLDLLNSITDLESLLSNSWTVSADPMLMSATLEAFLKKKCHVNG